MMDTSTTSIDNFGLHRYAIIGDDEGVRRSLRDGADINALDTAGRTALMCAVAGENWQNIDGCDASFMTPTRLNTLKTLLGHPDISLLTLNAPQSSMNGVIPLGMAAWLNQPQAVRTLLDDSADSVSVDGMDSHGATALMYAARDGSLEVVQALLSHGARPDFRDRNHRTSIQFALAHPQILWLCETILRRHRWRESRSADRTRLSPENEYLVELACSSMPFSDDLEPPPTSIFTQEALSRLNNTLISSIRNSDVGFLHSLLFAPSVQPSSPPALYPLSVPVLINLPDSNGWSLVHHCVSAPEPSIEILDALYCAGAEVSLFTTHEQQTPLHFLARTSHHPDSTHSLHDFVFHLIKDLRAPLSARDKDEETCIHIAAEHGHSIDLLMLFLHCDSNGTIRAMKNSRGLTALEVAKTEFLPAFGIDAERSNSALSNYTIRPSDSFASLSSLSDLHSLDRSISSDALSIFSATDFDVDAAVQQLLSILRATSPSGYHSHKLAHIQYLERSIHEISLHADSIIVHFRSRIEEATRVITDLQKSAERIDSVRDVVALATKSKLMVRGIAPLQSKRRHRDSEDSQTTFAVSDDDASDCALFLSSASTRVASCSSSNIDKDQYCSVGTQTALLDFYVAHSTLSRTDAAWMERFIRSPDSPVCRAHFTNLWDVECELTQLERQAMTPRSANASPTKVTMKLKQVLKKKKRLEEKIQDLELDQLHMEKKGSLSAGTSRFKAWIKRMVVPQQRPHSAPKLELVLDLESAESGNVGHEVKRPAKTPSTNCGDAIDRSIDRALRTSKVVLEAAHRDLMNINECLSAAQQFIDLANHSISRTQRVVKRAVKKRQTMLTELEQKATASSKPLPTIDESELSPGLLGYSNTISSRPSLASISTIYSTTSSIASVAVTLTENDDEDIRILRRLLLRKIEAQTSGAWDEVDVVTGWVQVVKEAVRSVKRRAYL